MITYGGDAVVVDGEDEGGEMRSVRGCWSHEEDQVLTGLVYKFGPRNWSVLAKGVPGRSGKSCRLRWFNQLDPCLKRIPFTEEEDQLIISAHTKYGNKWSVITKLLPGRTDNSVKNRWNSTLKRRCLDLSTPAPASHNTLDDGFLKKSKASSEESYEDPNSAKPHTVSEASMTPSGLVDCENVPEKDEHHHVPEKDVHHVPEKDVHHVPDKDEHHHVTGKDEHHHVTEKDNPQSDPTLFRPVAHIGAFGVHNHLGSVITKTASMQGTLLEASRPELGNIKVLNYFCGDPVVPGRCGYGCCASPDEAICQSSLLGPEFVDYQEIPICTSQELAALVSDLNNISWIKSGLETSV